MPLPEAALTMLRRYWTTHCNPAGGTIHSVLSSAHPSQGLRQASALSLSKGALLRFTGAQLSYYFRPDNDLACTTNANFNAGNIFCSGDFPKIPLPDDPSDPYLSLLTLTFSSSTSMILSATLTFSLFPAIKVFRCWGFIVFVSRPNPSFPLYITLVFLV